jgi:hypothetical protein
VSERRSMGGWGMGGLRCSGGRGQNRKYQNLFVQ